MDRTLTIEQARKRFSENQALDGVDLTLQRGEWLALLGPNGAGKTTLVRAIAGRVRLDGGEIELLGQKLDGRSSPVRRRLGIVPQEIALYGALSAAENLRTFGKLQGLRRSTLAERIEWARRWTGLTQRFDEPVQHFSGGMKRRLNIACAVLHRPDVVLLDEPTVGVDPQSRQRIWEMLDELRQQGASLLLTTHQLDEAQQLCDRIVIIDRGRVIAGGTLDELIERHLDGQRRLTLKLARPLEPARLQELVPGSGPFTLEGCTLSGTVGDLATELSTLLQALAEHGYRVEEVRSESPSLHSVFIHLTGRELRE